VKGEVRMMEIRWMNSDVNRPSGMMKKGEEDEDGKE